MGFICSRVGMELFSVAHSREASRQWNQTPKLSVEYSQGIREFLVECDDTLARISRLIVAFRAGSSLRPLRFLASFARKEACIGAKTAKDRKARKKIELSTIATLLRAVTAVLRFSSIQREDPYSSPLCPK